jgi:alkylation response protein AidB-like acyl-CoA dehydrogenase
VSVTLTPEQEDIRSVARRFLESVSSSEALRAAMALELGFDETVWRQMVDLGWPAMCLDEDLGGLSFGQVERCLLMEEMGRVLLPGPFLSTAVLAADAIALAGNAEAQTDLLPRLAEGEIRAALVAGGDLHAGLAALAGVTAQPGSATDWTLTGTGGLSLDAGTADILVVVAFATPDGATGVFVVDRDAPGVSVEAATLMDATRRFGTVVLDAASARRIDAGAGPEPGVKQALQRSTVALAAEMIGAAQRCLDMSVQYAQERRQFGVPIGSFQVIKHRCAILAVEVDAAREAVMHAAEVLTDGDPADAEIMASAAKSAAGDAFQRAAYDAVQIHGGIGFTDEHDAHLFFKRARTSGLLLGSTAQHRHHIAGLLGV